MVEAEADADPAAPNFVNKVFAAAAQGATAVTEPIVNRLLVERCTVSEALGKVKVADCLKFFLTTFPTNMLKFPIFEVINMMLTFTSMSGSMRGIVNGWLFCTIMLPVTNFRFRKSMNMPIDSFTVLYQAYPPTVFRDIVYGWSRGFVGGMLAGNSLGGSFVGKAFLFGVTVFAACILSSPFNELRGFWLQPKEKAIPFSQFFKPERYVRSTGVGATIMGIALFIGMLITPLAEAFFSFLKSHIISTGIVLALGVGAVYFKMSSKKPEPAKQGAMPTML